jgi:hypothetical protein
VLPRACTEQFFELVLVDAASVRLISSISGITIVAGDSFNAQFRNGRGDEARFSFLRSAVFTGAGGTGDLLVADQSLLRRISMSSFNSTAADPRTTVNVTHFAGDEANLGGCAYAEGTGRDARFCSLGRIKRLSSGDFVVPDKSSGSSILRLVTPAAQTSLLAGTPGQVGIFDGLPNVGRFCYGNLAATEDYMGSIYVAEYCQVWSSTFSKAGCKFSRSLS